MSEYDLTTKEIQEFTDKFAGFDTNNDSQISMDELHALNQSMDMKYTDTQLQTVMKEVDIDGNGSIDLTEYLTLMQREKQKDLLANEEELKHDFNIIDADKNGYINEHELEQAMSDYLGVQQTDESVEELMQRIDIDKDGQVDFPEFVQAVLSSSAQSDHNKAPQFTMKMVEDDIKHQLFTTAGEIVAGVVLCLLLLCGICKFYKHMKYRKARLYTALNVITEEEDLGVMRDEYKNRDIELEQNALL